VHSELECDYTHSLKQRNQDLKRIAEEIKRGKKVLPRRRRRRGRQLEIISKKPEHKKPTTIVLSMGDQQKEENENEIKQEDEIL